MSLVRLPKNATPLSAIAPKGTPALLHEPAQQPLTPFVAALTRFSGYEVDVRVSTEPGLLGGFVASVGDMVFDASLRRRLEQARSLLFAPPASVGEEAGHGPDQS